MAIVLSSLAQILTEVVAKGCHPQHMWSASAYAHDLDLERRRPPFDAPLARIQTLELLFCMVQLVVVRSQSADDVAFSYQCLGVSFPGMAPWRKLLILRARWFRDAASRSRLPEMTLLWVLGRLTWL